MCALKWLDSAADVSGTSHRIPLGRLGLLQMRKALPLWRTGTSHEVRVSLTGSRAQQSLVVPSPAAPDLNYHGSKSQQQVITPPISSFS